MKIEDQEKKNNPGCYQRVILIQLGLTFHLDFFHEEKISCSTSTVYHKSMMIFLSQTLSISREDKRKLLKLKQEY